MAGGRALKNCYALDRTLLKAFSSGNAADLPKAGRDTAVLLKTFMRGRGPDPDRRAAEDANLIGRQSGLSTRTCPFHALRRADRRLKKNKREPDTGKKAQRETTLKVELGFGDLTNRLTCGSSTRTRS